MSDKRQLIVVDTETSGLDPSIHQPIEVAAINVDTDETFTFVPHFGPDALAKAAPEALQVSRYFERGVWKAALNVQATADAYERLWQMLQGNTLAGANPRFDAEMLITGYADIIGASELDEPWHYRLPDVSSYVAGAFGIYPAEIPSLINCCKLLGVDNWEEHTALGDAIAAAQCFRLARQRSLAADPIGAGAVFR